MGCGWLGFPLAESLINKGYTVHGSTTSISKKEVLHAADIQPFVLKLSEDRIEGDITSFLKNTTILIINIPPKLRKERSENFVSKISTLIKKIQESSVEKILFISSTSVYNNDNTIVSEVTMANPETESGRQLLEVEQLLQNNPNFKTSVVRFGGLIGAGRHPVNFLSGRTNVKNPEAPVNLIHLNDCIGIITAIIEKNYWGEVFNGVYPHHPAKKEYYTKKTIEKNITVPKFNESEVSTGKTVISEKVSMLLNYKFTTEI